ncbi:hypothetical protein [Oceanirhabdus sp. W0125-5]|uniref:hypothetical protein n=1 Tax=Oceanirhabdus sp. W0125-5 TaxID=2999116 RepID=UPI0022F2D87E|nr:hypothetical protein [Oceanirhabdus sp. W0125-5]WBW96053.1 hypothetical protein OW730_20515 [Oceanirhabdus sp. W0125-5]
MKLENRIIKMVENDLKCYPDWVIKIECNSALDNRSMNFGSGKSGNSFSSKVELEAELLMELKRKVITIDKVMERLRDKIRLLIEQRYFLEYSREEILEENSISKKQYYTLRNKAFESFARAMGYIE